MMRPWFCYAPHGCEKRAEEYTPEMRIKPCMAASHASLSGDVGDYVGGGCSCGLQGAHAVLADSVQW